ncbi:MAG TPA: hypothetical protein VEG65_04790 [Candidatus Bathyarchaeia archaeon]|nr:hypothetical protein [Candidatus Bathyarchaeia archaeon]
MAFYVSQGLELSGFVDIFRKERGRGTDFKIQPPKSIDRKYASMIV